MELVDTHCHIHEAQFELGDDAATRSVWAAYGNPDPNHIIASAIERGVARMICVGTTLIDSRQAVSFVQGRPQCWASIGLHPHEAKDGQPSLDGLRDLLGSSIAGPVTRSAPKLFSAGTRHKTILGAAPPSATRGFAISNARAHKIVAIGECGLDYFYTHSPKSDQIKALRFQIELALQHNLPLIFHVREAFNDFLPILSSYKNIRGVVHSFTDTQANLDKLLERGLYIGVNGIATFTKNTEQLAMYKATPISNLLLETDAPFLTPAPLRGKMNEPANVRLVAEFLANLQGENLATIAAHTTQNAQTLFNL